MKYHFWLSLTATVIFLLWFWAEFGSVSGTATDAGWAHIYAEMAYRLVHGLTLYIAAIALIWSHGLFWRRENPATTTT